MSWINRLVAALILLLPVAAWGQCAPAGLLTGCREVVNPQPTDWLYVWQNGQNPHSRKGSLLEIGNTFAAANFASPPPMGNVAPNSVFSTTLSATGNAIIGGNLTANVLAAGSTTSRGLAQRGSECDSDGTNCTLYNMKDWGMSPSATAAVNRTALVSAIAAACAVQRGALLHIPAGQYQVDFTAGEILIPCSFVQIAGDGEQATLLVAVGSAGNFIHFRPEWDQAYAYGVGMRDLRIYSGSNPTSGAFLLIDHVNQSFFHNLEIDGGFRDVEIESGLNVYLTDTMMHGASAAAGSVVALMGRLETVYLTSGLTANGTAVMPFADTSEMFVGDYVSGLNVPANTQIASVVQNTSITLNQVVTGDVPGGTSITIMGASNSTLWASGADWVGGTRAALEITFLDGLSLVNAHLGFSTGPAVLFEPRYANDVIGGFACASTDFDSSQYGVRYVAYGGGPFSGRVSSFSYSGCRAEISTQDGFRVDDPAVIGITLSGFDSQFNQGNGINIQAGSGISIVGGRLRDNNRAAGAASHILIGGTASQVSVSGASFAAGVATVARNITVANTADYVNIGGNVYAGATAGDISITSTGTHNQTWNGPTDSATWQPVQTPLIHAQTADLTSIGIGREALIATQAPNNQNTALGDNALALTTGAFNTGVGRFAGVFNVTGTSNVYLGAGAGTNATGSSNMFAGAFAGLNVSSGAANTFVGEGAGQGTGGAPTTGSNNTAVGDSAGHTLQGAAANNTIVGYNAGAALTTGNGNVVIGYNVASTTLATGSSNILIGTGNGVDTLAAGTSNTISIENTWKATGTATTAPASVFAGTLEVTDPLHTTLNTMLGLYQTNVGNGEYEVFRLGVDGTTSLKSGYLAWVPNATANQAFFALGVRGIANDFLRFRADGVLLVGGTTTATAAVSCAASTVNLTTFTVTNGIVTAC